jgi:Domain of unknown function (DUF4157)
VRADKTSQPTTERSGSSLRVNAPDDAFEQEADRAAEAFVRGTGVAGGVPFSVGGISLLQRCGCGKTNAGGECDGCRKKRLQRRASPGPGVDAVAGTTAPPVVHDVLGSSGRALDGDTRARMESHFGADFSGVRLHTDERAVESAAEVSAEAWTVGNHIAFADPAFNPRSTEGQRLLAHELSHVVQQAGGLRRRVINGINPTVMDEYDEAKLWAGLKEEYRIKVQTGELDDSDLSNWVITSRLDGLPSARIDPLIALIKKHGEKNPKVSIAKIVEYLETRKTISTPLPKDATVSRDPLDAGKVESFSLTIGSARVKVVEDTFGNKGNETGPTTNFSGGFSWNTDGGKVSSLTRTVGGTAVPFNPTSFDVEIRTKYKENPDGTSAYGRGTTAIDKDNDATTLRVHEGSHGSDFIAWLRANPFPVDLSKGVVGVITDAQMKSVLAYVKKFGKEAGNYTCDHTDQVGRTQNEFLKTKEGKASGIVSCRPNK